MPGLAWVIVLWSETALLFTDHLRNGSPGIVIERILGHIGEGIHGALGDRGLTSEPVQEGHDLAAGADSTGRKHIVADAIGNAVQRAPFHRLAVPSIRRNVPECLNQLLGADDVLAQVGGGEGHLVP